MANEKFLNQTGLTYYHDRAKTVFADKATLEALDTKVDGIIAEGGEPNVIEKIKVNGIEQTITNKEVDIEVPTLSVGDGLAKVSNQSDNSFEFSPLQAGLEYTSKINNVTDTNVILASKDYVDENGGKIDKIKVNGVEQPITNKEVNLDLTNYAGMQVLSDGQTNFANSANQATSFIPSTNGLEYYADGLEDILELASKEYVDGKGSIAIDSSLNNKTTFTNGTSTSSIATSPDGIIYTEGATATEVPSKAYVDNAIADITGMEFVIVPELPTEGQKGKIYLLGNQSAGSNVYDEYIWVQDGANGRFEKIGSTDVDLSNYWNNTNLQAITTAEIDALFA